MIEEKWLPVVGYEGLYEVSNLGRIKSLNRKTKPTILKSFTYMGYQKVMLRKKTSPKYVHRLVLETFVGPCPEGMEACHFDGIRWNNRLDNLRWDTRLGNHQDRRRHGTTKCNAGALNGHAKLGEKEVRQIRSLLAAGRPAYYIAELFDVTTSNISHIKRGKSWRSII